MQPFLRLFCALPVVLLAAWRAMAIEVTVQSGLSSTYDYIVVGGGTGGLAIAARLAENKRNTVLIIEAGPFDQHEETIYYPHFAFPTQTGGVYDWSFPSLPQEFVANGNISVPRGKVVGGSSTINAMVFVRGSPADYDAWERLGNPGWGWKGMLPYFRKSETFTPPLERMAESFNITHVPSTHGKSGPVRVSYAPYVYDYILNFKNAFNILGIETPQDHAESGLGAAYVPSAQDPRTQTRSFSRTAYLDPVLDQTNLHILTSTLVLKILTDSSSRMPRATGVEILPDGGSLSTIMVNKEVILSAGAIQSPQLLQVSGIGPKQLLESLDIPVVVDLPGVGANFQDQPLLPPPWVATRIPFSQANLTSDPALDAVFRRMYETTLTGPWALGAGNFLGFLPLKTFADDAEDLISTLREQNATFLADGVDSTITAGYLRQKAITLRLLETATISTIEMIIPYFPLVLLHPMSRGSIYIDSPDMRQPPKIDWRAFTNPLDRQMLVSAIRFGRKLIATPYLEELGAMDGLVAGLESDEELLEFIYSFSSPSFDHEAGSCSMMPLELGGVVDPQLRVYGIDRLRVVDASIIPMMPGTHPQATVYAIAEKAADIIKSGR